MLAISVTRGCCSSPLAFDFTALSLPSRVRRCERSVAPNRPSEVELPRSLPASMVNNQGHSRGLDLVLCLTLRSTDHLRG